MQRPEFVTTEDIDRWSETVDNDETLPPGFATEPLLREVIYASFWMAENLKKEKCSDELITRMQYTMGSLSFGHDPWEVAQEMLQAYKDNDIEFEVDYNEDGS
jgi:hypothetical protein